MRRGLSTVLAVAALPVGGHAVPAASGGATTQPVQHVQKKAEHRQAKVKVAAANSVAIKDFSFGPGSITIHVGDTVTWVNNGPTDHTATANNGSFDTGTLKKGQSGSHTFNSAGSF